MRKEKFVPRPGWDDELKDMHPTCENNSDGRLSGQETSFLSRTRNKDVLATDERAEILRLWHKVRETM